MSGKKGAAPRRATIESIGELKDKLFAFMKKDPERWEGQTQDSALEYCLRMGINRVITLEEQHKKNQQKARAAGKTPKARKKSVRGAPKAKASKKNSKPEGAAASAEAAA